VEWLTHDHIFMGVQRDSTGINRLPSTTNHDHATVLRQAALSFFSGKSQPFASISPAERHGYCAISSYFVLFGSFLA